MGFPDGVWTEPGFARSQPVPDYTTGSLGVTIAFGCIVILHGFAFLLLKADLFYFTTWWFKVHWEGLGWKVGAKELPLLRWKVPWLVKARGEGRPSTLPSGWKGGAKIPGSKANGGGGGNGTRYNILHEYDDRV